MAAAAIFLGFLVQHMLDAGEVLSGAFEHVSACEKGECAGGWGGGYWKAVVGVVVWRGGGDRGKWSSSVTEVGCGVGEGISEEPLP